MPKCLIFGRFQNSTFLQIKNRNKVRIAFKVVYYTTKNHGLLYETNIVKNGPRNSELLRL